MHCTSHRNVHTRLHLSLLLRNAYLNKQTNHKRKIEIHYKRYWHAARHQVFFSKVSSGDHDPWSIIDYAYYTDTPFLV